MLTFHQHFRSCGIIAIVKVNVFVYFYSVKKHTNTPLSHICNFHALNVIILLTKIGIKSALMNFDD
eukprot:UN12770